MPPGYSTGGRRPEAAGALPSVSAAGAGSAAVSGGAPFPEGSVSSLPGPASSVPGIKTGLVTSGDYFIATKEQGDAILKHFPEALAVDMESGSIAQVCHLHGIPFLSLRIISDVAGENHQQEYDNFWSQLADNSFAAIESFLKLL